MNLFRISMSLLVLLTVWQLSPRTALAASRQQADSCADVRTWYLQVDDLKQQIAQRENDPTVSFGTRNPDLYRQAAALRDFFKQHGIARAGTSACTLRAGPCGAGAARRVQVEDAAVPHIRRTPGQVHNRWRVPAA